MLSRQSIFLENCFFFATFTRCVDDERSKERRVTIDNTFVSDVRNITANTTRKCKKQNTLCAFRSLLDGEGGFFTHSGDNSNQKVLTSLELGGDFLSEIALWDFDVVFGGAVLGHEIEETVVDVDKLVFNAVDVGDIHVVGGWTDIFQFLSGKDIDSNEMDFCVTVLPSLGSGHVNDLAWSAFDDDMSVFPQGRALHRESEGRAGASLFKGLMLLFIVRHDVDVDEDISLVRNGRWMKKVGVTKQERRDGVREGSEYE